MLAAVADGMGGLTRGAEAANAAITACGQMSCWLAGQLGFDDLRAALERINSEVYHAIIKVAKPGMAGTTLCAAVIRDDKLRLFWSGDSRAYLWRRGKILRLTEDHIYEKHLLALATEGVISVQQAKSQPNRGHLTGYIGMRELEDYSISSTATELLRGDGLLLCTDGLYKALPDYALRKYMSLGAEAAAVALIGALQRLNAKGQDNATALVIKW